MEELELLRCINDVVKTQHFDKLKFLARKIESTNSERSFMLRELFNSRASNEALDRLIDAWVESNFSSEKLAALLIGAAYAAKERNESESAELVWTGPESHLFPVRRSEQVLLDIINSAQESLFIVSFVLFNIPKVEVAIKQAITRGVVVRMLLESEDRESSSSFSETLDHLKARVSGIQLYEWPRECRQNDGVVFARVHAKCAVADNQRAFITSANLTEAALDRNIEMGVYLNGGSIPQDIISQLESMISTKEILLYRSKGKS